MVKLVFWKDGDFSLENHEGCLRVYRKGAVGPAATLEGFFRLGDKPYVRTTAYCTRAGEPVIVLIGVKRDEPFEGFRIAISRKDSRILSTSSYVGRMPRRPCTCR